MNNIILVIGLRKSDNKILSAERFGKATNVLFKTIILILLL